MVLAQPVAFLIILLATVVISVISTLAYKYTTDQKKMKRIKEKLKDLQAQMKEARGDQDKMLKLNGQIMKSHNEYSMQSMRSILFTIIPVMLIFIYLQANVAFTPIAPGDEFDMLLDYRDTDRIGDVIVMPAVGMDLLNRTDYEKSGFLGFGRMNGERITLLAPAEPGEYTVTFTSTNTTVNRSVIVTNGREYAPASVAFRESALRAAAIDYRGLRIFDIGWLPGWLQGWIAVYIILTLIFTNIFRKIMKVY